MLTFSEILENRDNLDVILAVLGFLTDFSCYEHDQDEVEGVKIPNYYYKTALLESNTI